MAGSLRDVRQVIRASLSADSAVRGLVSGRVYTASLREVEEAKRTYPLLTIEGVGGTVNYEAVVQNDVFALVAWSQSSSDEAAEVYEAAFNAIQATRLVVAGITPVVVCQETARPIDGWSEGHQAWFCSGRWLARANA